MEVIHARCCGIDVHQASLAVCVSIKEEAPGELPERETAESGWGAALGCPPAL